MNKIIPHRFNTFYHSKLIFSLIFIFEQYMIFSNMKGTFPTLTWNEHVLDKEVSRVDEKGRRYFCAPQKLIASEEQNHLVIAEELLELFSISTEYDEDEDEQDGTINVRSGKSSSSEDPIDSTDVELKEILAIFRGVSTTRTVRKAFHLLLLFNTTSYKTISKYIFEMFILFIIPVILLKNNRDANILNLIY